DDSYLAFLSDPFPVSQNAAQASIITSQDPTSQPIIAYVPIYNHAEQVNNPSQAVDTYSVVPTPTGGTSSYQNTLAQNQDMFQDILDHIANFSTTQAPSDPTSVPNADTPTPTTGAYESTDLDIPATEISYPISTVNTVKTCLSNLNIYRQAESKTGVPWKILAGIHYVEGGCSSNKSCVSGRTIGINEPDLYGNCSSSGGEGQPVSIAGGCGFRSLLDSCIYGANHLKGKIGGLVPTSIEDLAKSLGRYNGLGNANCGRVNASMPYCPAKYEGYDHIYPMSKYDSIHQTMYLVYCADYTKCNPPKVWERIGVLAITQILTKLGY
nr:hypothetical protein [Candidatus Woesebacteria bacterium]